jgi:imidazolonepropionase-like amidohydrolase
MQLIKHIKISVIPIVIICLCSFSSLPKTDNDGIIAIRGGTLVTITNGNITNGILLIEGGKITAIGKDINIPEKAQIIDAGNYTILPGFIDSFTNLGAVETEGIEETREYDEATSPITPHLKIIDGINSESSLFPAAIRTGVTTVLCAPGEGNLLSGQSALLQLVGDSVDEMVLKFPVGIHGSLGEPPKLRYGKKNINPSTRMGEAALLRQTLIDTQDYAEKIESYKEKLKDYAKKGKEGKAEADKKPVPPPTDFKLQSLIPVIKRELPLILRANRYDDILTALRIAEEFKLQLILNQGADAYKTAKKLAVRNIPVILGQIPPYRSTQETMSALYENAALLHKAGVKIAFQTGSAHNLGSLLQQASLSVSHGLPYQVALKALTINPAQIFGLEKELGSLEKGKRADIVIFDGDPLNSLSHIKMVIIEGQIVFEESS